MKKNLLICIFSLSTLLTFGQTFSVHKVDDCKILNATAASGGTGTYDAVVTNPNASVYTATDVSSFDTTNGGTSTTGSFRNIQLRLADPIPVGTVIDFSARFYSANAGSNGVGSGNFEVRLVNSTIGNSGTTHVKLLTTTDKVGGAWQTETNTNITASATDNTGIITNGGFDTIIIFGVSNAGTANELFYFDDILLSPYVTVDETADLDAGNVWVYNNREGNNKLPFTSFGATSVNENIATPSTDGNSATTVLRYTKANSFSTFAFSIPAISPPFTGTVKFRVYLDNCAPDLANTMRIRLQSTDNASLYNTANLDVVTLTDKKWVECSFDLANLTGGDAGKAYDDFQIVVDQADNALKDGFLYYFDAIQGPFAGTTNFTNGSGNSSWTDAGNWDGGVPTALSNVIIPTGNTVGIFGTVQTATNDLTLQGDASVFLQGPAPELIVNGSFGIGTGNVTYRRRGLTTNWHLVSAPVQGVTFNNDAVLDDGTIGSNQGLGIYNEVSNSWTYKQTGVDVNATNGMGYALRPETTSDFVFTGTTLNNSDVSVAVGNSGSGFNLLGNPFTSSINITSFLNANTTNLVSETIWVWDQSIAPSGAYVTKVTADNFVLAPAQGFFARSSNGTNLVIAKSSQTTGGTFQKSAKTEVKLFMNDGESYRFAKIYYLSDATTGFDNGFDGETFGGIPSSVDVFTNLIKDNQGKQYQVQSLPNSNYENMIIPIGVIADADKEITFTADAISLPSGIKVFLEDKVKGVFTRLDETNSSYKVTLDGALNDVGRFYLHTSSSALSVDDVRNSSEISIFSTSKNNLRIAGVDGAVSLEMYNVLGKQVLQTSFKSNGISDVTLPSLSKGIYIVKLTSNAGNLNKKIILE